MYKPTTYKGVKYMQYIIVFVIIIYLMGSFFSCGSSNKSHKRYSKPTYNKHDKVDFDSPSDLQKVKEEYYKQSGSDGSGKGGW
ncbi:hypothetical protein [Clostridium ganghwense]|uniref:Lipoprotein n=1 Tax=Clostridium ganghwense TaxID=312089 RepID=A0ABT4CSU2_9CLOT|nr:hypothetical protein [Clostridium ganghwense]MCY6372139.1 hypothetical protein [Clostridium ganghwense]